MTRPTIRRQGLAALAILMLGAVAAPAAAQSFEPASLDACVNIANNAQRLACYDRVAGREPAVPSEVPRPEATTPEPPTRTSKLVTDLRDYLHQNKTPDEHSLLDSRWELDRDTKLGTFNVRGYKPVFIEPVFLTSRTNELPTSPNPDNVVHRPLQLDATEAKFQISFKTKIIQGLLGGYGDVWAGYTQSSRWQVYNDETSRPFRETNYEPEVMLVFGTNIPLFGWDVRMLSVGLNHQSNGRGKPHSRSWNRVMGRIGLERRGWTVMLRPWWRLSEDPAKDDNPDILKYLGHGDLTIIREWHQQEFSLMLRQNFDTGYGATRFTWSFPIGDGLHGYLELFNGYGESLIDYNHRATYVGLGLSLVEWY